MEKLIGEEFRLESSVIPFAEALGSVESYVCLYFGGHWCPPCRPFTTVLKDVYQKVNIERKIMEVIFCSYDGSEEAFESNYAKMPWLTIPWDDQRLKTIK